MGCPNSISVGVVRKVWNIRRQRESANWNQSRSAGEIAKANHRAGGRQPKLKNGKRCSFSKNQKRERARKPESSKKASNSEQVVTRVEREKSMDICSERRLNREESCRAHKREAEDKRPAGRWKDKVNRGEMA